MALTAGRALEWDASGSLIVLCTDAARAMPCHMLTSYGWMETAL